MIENQEGPTQSVESSRNDIHPPRASVIRAGFDGLISMQKGHKCQCDIQNARFAVRGPPFRPGYQAALIAGGIALKLLLPTLDLLDIMQKLLMS
jgi:hypothetical protein